MVRTKNRQQGGDPCWRFETLTLRELEAFSRSRLPVLLTLLHSRVACKEARFLQNPAQFRTEIYKCTSDAVLNGAGLTAHTATFYIHENIEFIKGFRCL